MKTEHILRVGREDDTNYASRAEEFIAASYFFICNRWHHAELDSSSTSLALNTSNNTCSISTLSPGIVQGVALRQISGGSGAFIKMMTPRHFRDIVSRYNTTAGEPSYYARHGTNLFVDRLPDLAYELTIYYYDTEPAAPDYASGSPAIGRAWDEAILEYSCYLAHKATDRPDLANTHLEMFSEQVETMPNPRLVEVLQAPLPSGVTKDIAHGGPNG